LVKMNTNRPNGKAFKKKPKVQRKNGKTIGGYSLSKLAKRMIKRGQEPIVGLTNYDVARWFYHFKDEGGNVDGNW